MEQVRLRRIGGTLYIRMPPDFIRTLNLSDGDELFLVPREDGATLKVIRAEQITDLVSDDEEVAAE
jgi:antitoxin component of MazEF toxin-antitoxin module